MNLNKNIAATLAVMSVVTPSFAAGGEAGSEARYFALVAASFERASMPVAGHRATAEDYRELVLASFERTGVRLSRADRADEAYGALIRASFERQGMAVVAAPFPLGSGAGQWADGGGDVARYHDEMQEAAPEGAASGSFDGRPLRTPRRRWPRWRR